MNGTYLLPFGNGRKWLSSGILSRIAGGWGVSVTGIIQSGTPLANPSGYFINGNPHLSNPTMQQWFNTSPKIWVPIPPYTLSNVPLNNPDVRNPTAPQFDGSIYKTFTTWKQQQLRLRLTAFNLTNTPFFYPPDTDPTSPQFGVVAAYQENRPRSVELGARYTF